MIKEINFVRQYPKVYASIIANYLSNESKSWWGLNKDEYDAGLELIDELKSMKPLIEAPLDEVATNEPLLSEPVIDINSS